MFVLQLACGQISNVTLLVFMKQLRTLTTLPDVCSAARMRPDPDLPAFSMETPLRVAQALLQALAVLLPFLLTCPPPTPSPPKPVQSPDLDVDRPAKQPTILEQIIANSPSLPDAYKHHVGSHKNTGRPLPAGLPLQQKFDQASVQRLIGECSETSLKAFASFIGMTLEPNQVTDSVAVD